MTDMPSILAQLMADCDSYGIRLLAAGNDRLTIDAPHDAVTPDLLGRLKAHKVALLAILGATRDTEPAPIMTTRDAPTKPTKPICRCGSTSHRDVVIHAGQSVRRDCGRCSRFIDFPVWYGKNTFQNEQ